MIFLISFGLLWAIKKIGLSKLKKIAEKTENNLDDALVHGLDEVGWPFFLAISTYAATYFANFPAFTTNITGIITLAISMFYLVRILQKVIYAFTESYIAKQERSGNKSDPTIIIFFSRFISYTLWLFAVLIIAENAGFDINSLIAGLGVAGIAIALAIQSILSDVFSSVSIYFDKPFRVGDFIIIDKEMGVVKKIGIKTTRIQALQGEEIVVSNKELTESRIHNFGKMKERRVEFRFGVTYETPIKKLKMVNALVKAAVDKIGGARLDRVHFKSFGDSSLIFEAVYYVPTGDYFKYMDAQETINFALKSSFEKGGIEFAYPTQKIYLAK